MIFYQNKQSGFSLVETLVAVSILMIVITGPMSISMRTAKSSSFASEQIEAFFLAQEGLELAQKGRDDLFLQYFNTTNNDPWGDFTNNTSGVYRDCYHTGTTGGCGLVWNPVTPTLLTTPVDCSTTLTSCLLYRTSTGRSKFTHVSAGNIATPFTRRIFFVASGDEVKITSIVTWRTGSIVADQKVEVSTYLYNVYDI